VAGAILAELDLLGAVELQGKRVRATGSTPATEFEHELELIRAKSRPHTPKWWVGVLESRAEVLRVYEGLVSLGIVEHVGEKHLGRFRAVRFPEKDHAPEAALLDRLQAALSGPSSNLEAPDTTETADGMVGAGGPEAGGPEAGASGAGGPAEPAATASAARAATKAPDARTIVLIALLQAAGLLGKLFPEADRIRASELSKDYWPSRAVEDELRLIRLAEEEAANL
jgi:hypothetical protein